MNPQNVSGEKVAIVGGGPGGLVAAKYLTELGYKPTIFEQSDGIGGQWNCRAAHSGVWPSMRANSSRVMTGFSDFHYAPGVATFPSEQQVCGYLERYAAHFGLTPHIRLGTRIETLERDLSGAGWLLRSVGRDTARVVENFPRVIVASGRYNKPSFPSVPGLASFSGSGGVTHTFDYKGPDPYRGRRVLVAGGSVSALEVASSLAMGGDTCVFSSVRRQRYVLPSLLAGVPIGHAAFTRFAALSGESLPREVAAAGLKEFVLHAAGSPEQFGALKPDDDIRAAGVTQCQHFLPLVAEGHIQPKPWIREIEGQTVRFCDGTEETVDALIFGTGYQLHLPFLSEDIRRALNLDARHMDLHQFTFHPDLDGLAFLGLYELSGPNFPVLELQARWIAYAWCGVQPMPSREQMEAGLAAYRERRDLPQQQGMHILALLFARAAGVEPELFQWPHLARALLYGPLTPVSFRLSGPESLSDAAERFAGDAREFGAVPSPQFTEKQQVQLRALAAARNDPDLDKVVDLVNPLVH